MRNKRMHGQGAQEIMTDFERSKILRVHENQERLRELGVKNIAKSLTSLAVAENTKKRHKKAKVTDDKDVVYNPVNSVHSEENYQEVATRVTATKKLHRQQYIAPMSMNRYANLSKQRVSAPNISRVIPCADGSLRNQPRAGITMGERNTLTTSISGPRRKIFSVDDDEWENILRSQVDKEHDGTHDDENEEIENAIFKSICNGVEGEDVRTLAEKIEQMKNYKPSENESSPTDPFLAVMNKEYDGHRRHFGTTSLEAENGQHADKYRKLEEVYEWKNVELKEENEKKLELMRKEFVNERANLVEDTMRKILEKLPPEVARMVIT
ncbi:hypothetical protein Tco_0938051 [Tanacetum coccineum]|uniref:Uncharacterized protein n=1 Tax=Tanacetum coccineum TaxID=301880 RepID=A0ABQ5DG20_9ASTR